MQKMGDFTVPPLEHTPWPTPSRAIYGFVLYVSTYVLFVSYLLWGLLPDRWLHAIGLTYLPARHWVITFPFLLCFGILGVLLCYIVKVWINFRNISHESDDEIYIEAEDVTDLDEPVGECKTTDTAVMYSETKMHRD